MLLSKATIFAHPVYWKHKTVKIVLLKSILATFPLEHVNYLQQNVTKFYANIFYKGEGDKFINPAPTTLYTQYPLHLLVFSFKLNICITTKRPFIST